MRMIQILVCGGVAVALCGAVIVGQGTGNEPPSDRATIFTLADLRSQIREDQANRLLEGHELFSLNLLHRSASAATVHAEVADLYIVQAGSATLETGGILLDPTPAGRPGDQRGSDIEGGTRRVIKQGDIVFIPPGVAHRFTGGDIWYLNVHFPGTKK